MLDWYDGPFNPISGSTKRRLVTFTRGDALPPGVAAKAGRRHGRGAGGAFVNTNLVF